MRIFKRKLYDKLLEWKNNRHGKTAVLIEGARRVGKSTLTKQFAENEYESYVMIDFSIVRDDVLELFNHIDDLDYFFLQLQFRLGVSLKERKSLVIFDEVQKCPKARQAIKHLVADGRYDYIETGSLISIKKNVKDILIPSEEEKLFLYPMDYEEFKWALGDNTAIPQLKKLFDKKLLFPQNHSKQNVPNSQNLFMQNVPNSQKKKKKNVPNSQNLLSFHSF